MENFIGFVIDNWELSLLWVVLLVALLVTESKRAGKSISSAEAVRLMNREEAVVLDIRESKEFSQGHITGAMNIPFNKIEERYSELNKTKGKPIILVCKMGQHSGSVAKSLRKKGFEDIRRLSGGMTTWQSDNLPVVK